MLISQWDCYRFWLLRNSSHVVRWHWHLLLLLLRLPPPPQELLNWRCLRMSTAKWLCSCGKWSWSVGFWNAPGLNKPEFNLAPCSKLARLNPPFAEGDHEGRIVGLALFFRLKVFQDLQRTAHGFSTCATQGPTMAHQIGLVQDQLSI